MSNWRKWSFCVEQRYLATFRVFQEDGVSFEIIGLFDRKLNIPSSYLPLWNFSTRGSQTSNRSAGFQCTVSRGTFRNCPPFCTFEGPLILATV